MTPVRLQDLPSLRPPSPYWQRRLPPRSGNREEFYTRMHWWQKNGPVCVKGGEKVYHWGSIPVGGSIVR